MITGLGRSHQAARCGVVVTAHPAASEAGRRAFRAGGNAVDAAVAAAWALSVCEPSGSGLGGQTVLLLHRKGKTIAVDGHSRAPAVASTEAVTRAQQNRGHRATTVPTTPITLAYVHGRYGRLSTGEVLEPAIALAEEGYEVSELQHRQTRWCRNALSETPAAARFLPGGRVPRPGETFRQPELAACLRRLAACGVEDFYSGAVARAIAHDMRANNGLLGLSDLAAVTAPRECEPVVSRYRGHVLVALPAPGGGPQLAHALTHLEAQGDGAAWCGCPSRWYQSVASAIHKAFTDREREHRQQPQADRVPTLGGVSRERGGETTHLCAVDAEGDVVSLTQSIQSLFGAKVANPAYGFLYNNYLTTCPRRRHAHRLAGGCSARSNAAPALLFRDTQTTPVLALGAAGSRRITSSLVQVISGVIDLELSLAEAIGRPRVHPRLHGSVLLERPAADRSLVLQLRERYREVEIRRRHSYVMGSVQGLTMDGAQVVAAADPRRGGAAATW